MGSLGTCQPIQGLPAFPADRHASGSGKLNNLANSLGVRPLRYVNTLEPTLSCAKRFEDGMDTD